MDLITFDAIECDMTAAKQAMEEHGYLVLHHALNLSEVLQLRSDLEPHFAARPNSEGHFWGFKTQRIEALLEKSSIVQRMVTHPIVLELTNTILGPNCDGFQLNLTQGIRINSGERAQIIHPDSAMFPISNKPFEFVVNALWAYSPFTKANGATAIVPGSHKWPEGRQPLPYEITYAEMPAGSVLIYAASLLHGGGANVTADARTGIAISYCLGWLRQSENQYLSYAPEVAKGFSEDLQRLIGYNVHKPNLGWVRGHDPIELLRTVQQPNRGAEDFLTEDQNALLQEYYAGANVAVTNHAA